VDLNTKSLSTKGCGGEVNVRR